MQAEKIQDSPSPAPKAVSGPSHSEAPTARESTPAARRSKRPFVILGGLMVLVIGSVGGYLLHTAGQETTDDAQVVADMVPVASRIFGQIERIAIVDNQKVKAGALIAEIDDSDYIAKVKQAEAELASAIAQAAQADAQIDIVIANSAGNLSSAKAAYKGSSVGVAAAAAQVQSAQAALQLAQTEAHKAEVDLQRVTQLRQGNAASQQQLDNAQNAFDAAQASLARAQAQLALAEQGRKSAAAQVSEAAGRVAVSAPIDAQVAAARANAELAHARVQAAEANLELAGLQLSYTKITAPADGFASRLSVHKGQLVSIGQPIVELVPTATYVVANFKETQIDGMRVGSRARLEIDAYPQREFFGTVESISGGTGSSFSLLPADNASGNFVKVVQRVPVKIAWEHLPDDLTLRSGLSVEATVYVGER